MKRMTLYISICCAVLGSAVILLSGMKHGDTTEEWKPLNAKLESTPKVDMQTPVTHTEQTTASGGNSGGGNGKRAALEPAKMEQTAQPTETAQPAQTAQP
ncbi:hypothetical protein, partial [Paenibacillus sp.]|uniref:hypothetical protein n=1 Tax=Paenibacillus sp. TaxID=58172 RepID=UPI002838D0D0